MGGCIISFFRFRFVYFSCTISSNHLALDVEPEDPSLKPSPFHITDDNTSYQPRIH